MPEKRPHSPCTASSSVTDPGPTLPTERTRPAKRARSLQQSLDFPPPDPDRDSSPQLLTEENLRILESFASPYNMMSSSRNSSPTRKDTAITQKKKLHGYNITVDEGVALPKQLADFVETLRLSRDEEPSPHAQAIFDKRRCAALENEAAAQKIMDEHILFGSEAYPGAMKGLTLKDQTNLVRDFLPEPPRATTLDIWGSLARPQPDSCIGYITAMEARAMKVSMPFTLEEDDMAGWYNVVQNAATHFPFLTAQWKAAISGENQFHASLQAARDGALIVNYLHKFYSQAYPDNSPSQLETCHFSVTTEMYTCMLWIHWREENPVDGKVYYRMEEVETSRMNKLNDLREMRKLLHNYIDFALGERLMSIKKALHAFWPNRPMEKVKDIQSESSVTTSVLQLQLDRPLRPSSSVDERGTRAELPTKRAKRVLDDIT